MKIRTRAVVVTAIVALAASACSSNSADGGGETTAAKDASDFSRTVDLGGGYHLSLDVPAEAAVLEDVPEDVSKAVVFVATREGHDLSGMSAHELAKPQSDQWTSETTTLVTMRMPCLNFDTWRNREDTVDAISPLNGQTVSYLHVANLEDLMGKKVSASSNKAVWDEDQRGAMYALKLGDSPCEAMMVAISWMKGAPKSPLVDLGYQVFVEGDGVLTSP